MILASFVAFCYSAQNYLVWYVMTDALVVVYSFKSFLNGFLKVVNVYAQQE